MAAETTPDGACRLDRWGVIRARGEDAAAFLQGQLTNDVQNLDARHARLAGFCSAKGRLQASFVVWRPAADELLLACSADLLAATLKRLSMFVLRARCRLSDASAEVPLWGVAGASAAPLVRQIDVWARGEGGVGAGMGVEASADADANANADADTDADADNGTAAIATVIRLPDAAGASRCLVAGAAAATLLRQAPLLPADDWHWLEVRSGVVGIEAATVDRFVPQMINFELVGGVDFKKGCYPGQEVVARSQYRGTTKRRALLFDCDAAAVAGQDVYDAADAAGSEPVGVVAAAARRSGSAATSALIELRLTSADSDALRLGAADGAPLRRVELPYPLPAEAAAA